MPPLVLVLALSGSMLVPGAEPPAVANDVHAQRAGALFEDGHYVQAAQEFALAFESTQQAVFLFAQAQALRRAGSCGGAIEVLRRYLASSPAEADQAEAERIIEACEELLRASSAPPPTASREPVPAEQPQVAAPSRVRPVIADRWGASLVGAGAGAGVLGAVLLGTGHRMARPRLLPEADYEVRQARVRGLSASGTVLLSVGAGLIVAGVVRYAIVARRRKTTARRDARAQAARRGSVHW